METTGQVGDKRKYSLKAEIERKELQICEKLEFYEQMFKHFKSICEDLESLYGTLSTRFARLRETVKPLDDKDKLELQNVEEMRVQLLEEMLEGI